MNFNQSVDREVVDAILESSLWKKANINVVKRESLVESSEEEEVGVVAEYERGVANEYEEPSNVEEYEAPVDGEGFTLDDLQVVLDNLQEDDLMEHAMSMLEVFDVAYEAINEGGDLGDEEEDDEEEDDE